MASSRSGLSLFSQRGEVAASGRRTPTLPPSSAALLLSPLPLPPLSVPLSSSLPQAARNRVSTATPATAIFRIRISGVPFRWVAAPLFGGRRGMLCPTTYVRRPFQGSHEFVTPPKRP